MNLDEKRVQNFLHTTYRFSEFIIDWPGNLFGRYTWRTVLRQSYVDHKLYVWVHWFTVLRMQAKACRQRGAIQGGHFSGNFNVNTDEASKSFVWHRTAKYKLGILSVPALHSSPCTSQGKNIVLLPRWRTWCPLFYGEKNVLFAVLEGKWKSKNIFSPTQNSVAPFRTVQGKFSRILNCFVVSSLPHSVHLSQLHWKLQLQIQACIFPSPLFICSGNPVNFMSLARPSVAWLLLSFGKWIRTEQERHLKNKQTLH